MTREEITNSRAYQVTKAALEYYNEHHQDKDINLTDAFEAGAKWADKTLIYKACEWLNKELFTDKAEPNRYYDTDVKSLSYDTKEDLLFAFRKAMEE